MYEEFRPSFGRGLTVVMAVIALVVFVYVAITEGGTNALLTLPWLCLFVTCCWAIFWRPCVAVSDAGVRLVNITRTIDLPWPSLLDVETRYALTLDTAYGRFRALGGTGARCRKCVADLDAIPARTTGRRA